MKTVENCVKAERMCLAPCKRSLLSMVLMMMTSPSANSHSFIIKKSSLFDTMYSILIFFEEIWFFHEGHTLDCNIIKLVFILQNQNWPDWIDIQHWRQPSVLYVSFVWFPFLSFSRFFCFSQLSTTSLAASLHSLLISSGCSSDQPFLSLSFCFSFSHYLFIEATSSSSSRKYISLLSSIHTHSWHHNRIREFLICSDCAITIICFHSSTDSVSSLP